MAKNSRRPNRPRNQTETRKTRANKARPTFDTRHYFTFQIVGNGKNASKSQQFRRRDEENVNA
jgi:hypothetical protein